jgi:tRNA dimethylallyltransferase
MNWTGVLNEGNRPMAQPVFLLMGPTASGKTRHVIDLASHFPIEVVSVDSAMVYRGLDIGTAKPGLDVRRQVPHHLIDILDPAESYSVGQFVNDARRLIREIHARNRVPVLVGGSFLYFHSWWHGLSALPASNPEIRSAIEKAAHRVGWRALHAELLRLDPVAGRRIHPNDQQRIARAHEVMTMTGKRLSDLQNRSPASRDPGVCAMAVAVTDRDALCRRISIRIDEMIRAGWLDEVSALRARGDLHPRLPSLRSVGYADLWHCLEKPGGMEQTRLDIVQSTMGLAKRQMTWLRRFDVSHLWDVENPSWPLRMQAVFERWAG